MIIFFLENLPDEADSWPGEIRDRTLELKLHRNDVICRLFLMLGYIGFHSIYRIHVEGRENIPLRGPGIILPKHQFWTDIPIVGLTAGRPLNYIAKQELFVYPIVRHFLKSLGGIPINRLGPVKSRHSFRYVETILRKGEFVVLFPEGTYYPNCLGRGKRGFIQAILRFQERMELPGNEAIPFIPMGIRYQEGRIRTGVHVKIGQPLFSRKESEVQGFTDRIVEEIGRLSGLKMSAKD